MKPAPVVLLVAVVLAAAWPIPALAQEEGTVVGRPSLELSATDNRFGVGERAVLDVFVSNTGDIDRGGPAEYEQRVTTARNVQLEIERGRMDEELAGNVEVRTGTVFAGTVPEGVSGPFGFNVELSDSLEPGTYEVPVEVSYDYTTFVEYGQNRAPEYGDGSRTTTAFVTVVVEDRPRFEVRSSNLSRVTAGDAATYRLNVTNTGTRPAVDAEVALSAANSSLFFGGVDASSQRTSVFIDRLDPGESRTVSVTVGADADTAPGTYLADGVVAYENTNGVAERSERLTFGVAVGREQTFALRTVDGTLRVGDTGLVTGRVLNTGETNVTDAVLTFAGNDSAVRPRETQYAVGDLAAGESTNFSFRIDVANDTDPGPRQLDFRVEYRTPAGERRVSDALSARVAVGRERTFAVRDVQSDLQVGDSGTVSGAVVNTGETNVTDAVVVLGTEATGLQPRSTAVAVGTLEPGESAPFEFTVDAPNDSDPGPRQVTVRVRYRTREGDPRVSEPLDASVLVGEEQRFVLANVTGRLQAGDTGDLSGVVVNAGDRPVSNAVVVLETDTPNLDPREREVAVGTLGSGESAPFEFAVDVNSQAEPGARQVSFRVRYRNPDDDLRASDSLDAAVQVTEDVDEFRVEPVEATLPAGSSEVVAFRVTNTADETLRDVTAQLFATDPLSTDNDEAFVSRLAPGESTTLRFGLAVADGAIAKTYPVSMDFTYENERGDTVLSDTYRSPVEVTEPRRRELPVVGDVSTGVVAVAGFAVVALALAWWKRDSLVGR